jgi:hypothetical protein
MLRWHSASVVAEDQARSPIELPQHANFAEIVFAGKGFRMRTRRLIRKGVGVGRWKER